MIMIVICGFSIFFFAIVLNESFFIPFKPGLLLIIETKICLDFCSE